jgi:hypothetical protein
MANAKHSDKGSDTSKNAPSDDRLPNSRGACGMVSNRRRSYVTEWRFIMQSYRGIVGAAGVGSGGISTMYKRLHIVVI